MTKFKAILFLASGFISADAAVVVAAVVEKDGEHDAVSDHDEDALSVFFSIDH